MMTLHTLSESRSQRIEWALNELRAHYQDFEFEIVRHQRDPQSKLAPKSLSRLHPLGKAPLLLVDGQALAESAVILQHLADKIDVENHFNSRSDRTGFALSDYFYWMHYAESSLMPLLFLGFFFQELTQRSPFFVRGLFRGLSWAVGRAYLNDEWDRHLDFLSETLKKQDYLCASGFSFADIQVAFVLLMAESMGWLTEVSIIKDYLGRLKARPHFIAIA